MVKKANELWSYVMRECSPKNRQHFFWKFLRIKYHNDVTKAEFSAHQKYIFYDILEEEEDLLISYFWDPTNKKPTQIQDCKIEN